MKIMKKKIKKARQFWALSHSVKREWRNTSKLWIQVASLPNARKKQPPCSHGAFRMPANLSLFRCTVVRREFPLLCHLDVGCTEMEVTWSNIVRIG